MPTVYADQIAGSSNEVRAVNLGDRTPGDEQTPRVNFIRSTYTFDGTEAAADKIRLAKLPAGSVVLGHLALITSDGIASTATVDIGDDDVAGVGTLVDVDRYVDGADVAAAGNDLGSAYAGVAQRTPYVLGADSWIEATLVTLVTPVAGKKLQFLIPYIGA